MKELCVLLAVLLCEEKDRGKKVLLCARRRGRVRKSCCVFRGDLVKEQVAARVLERRSSCLLCCEGAEDMVIA